MRLDILEDEINKYWRFLTKYNDIIIYAYLYYSENIFLHSILWWLGKII